MENKVITIETIVNVPVAKVWQYWNKPEHIIKWAFASDEWQCPKAENDLKVDGTFTTRMEAKDGSSGFDFSGIYTNIEENKLIAYELGDGRKVRIIFREMDGKTYITESFDPESENSVEMQRNGWQAILNNFKKHVEG